MLLYSKTITKSAELLMKQKLFSFFLFFTLNIPILSATTSDTVVHRSDQAEEDTWDLSAMYVNYDAWKRDLEEERSLDYEALLRPYRESEKLTAPQLKELLDLTHSLRRRLEKPYTWAHLRHDQDLADDENKQALRLITARRQTLSEQLAWVKPKILSHDPKEIEAFANAPELATYKTLLERLVRLKPHTLPKEQESLLAMSRKALLGTNKAFLSLQDADLSFPDAADKDGKLHRVTSTSYKALLQDPDRILRKNAFEALFRKYQKYENTFAELLNGEIQAHYFEARARNYSSCLEAALYPNNVPTSVYHTLIDAVHRNISVLHRYIGLKKRILGVETLNPWDFLVPLVSEKKAIYPFDTGVELTLAACQPLGTTYFDALKKGLTTDRWADKYENENKCSTDYSRGCYDSPPYMLLNYKDELQSVFTLAHEAGHSMHSHLSIKQPYHYAYYPIFVAEVASTFNEELLSRELLHRTEKDATARADFLDQRLRKLWQTFFLQTLFAEFELFIHEQVEKGEPITPKILNEKYLDLGKFYYGEELNLTPESALLWARIPHFYYNFYVYQYSTGISAAQALADRVYNGGEKERNAYLTLLESGCSQFPIDLLKAAGVDMTKGDAVQKTIDNFSSLLDQFEELLPLLK